MSRKPQVCANHSLCQGPLMCEKRSDSAAQKTDDADLLSGDIWAATQSQERLKAVTK